VWQLARVDGADADATALYRFCAVMVPTSGGSVGSSAEVRGQTLPLAVDRHSASVRENPLGAGVAEIYV
jgi:hypothetical protein